MAISRVSFFTIPAVVMAVPGKRLNLWKSRFSFMLCRGVIVLSMNTESVLNYKRLPIVKQGGVAGFFDWVGMRLLAANGLSVSFSHLQPGEDTVNALNCDPCG
jgi:hypothetical protein